MEKSVGHPEFNSEKVVWMSVVSPRRAVVNVIQKSSTVVSFKFFQVPS